MQELRFVAVSEDGRYAVLAVPGRSARFTLPIDERLRAVALGQTSRLVQYEIEVESPLRPKEIQARIRAGETVEEIADAAGIAVERVRWFEGPVLAERAYMADQAQRASVRRRGDSAPSTPGPRLGEIVAERLQTFGSDPEDAQWDAKKRGDGSWQVQLAFISGGRLHEAEWVFDPRRRHVLPVDDNAARMSLPGGEPPQPAEPPPGEATVTQLAPRLSTASGQAGTGTSGFAPVGSGHGGSTHGSPGHGNTGNGGSGNAGLGNGGRARHERPGSSRAPVSEPASSTPTPPTPPAPEVPAAAAPETSGDDLRPSAAGRHSPAKPGVPEPSRPAQAPVTEPPGAAASAPVTPATVAAQVSKAPQAPRSPQTPQPTRAPESSQGSRPSQPEVKEPRPETTVPAARPESTVPAAAAASPARGAKPESAAPAEPVSEQAGRQSRKSARGKRASVPSWDEIMFGSARQRD
jgi:hypothetical protein